MENTNQPNKKVARLLQLIDQLSTGDHDHKVEFFFYSRQIEWAHILANNLRSLDYEVHVTPSDSSVSTYLVNGWTPPMDLQEDRIEKWSAQMTEMASQCQSKFDGWGTIVD